MMKIKKQILQVACFLMVGICWGQELPNVAHTSPEAASLGQYAETPVSYYTGIPNISIPVYTVQSGELQLPINLSYHASGIKVNQEASWVGLGWSLNAVGMISRQMRGIDDFSDYGYPRTGALPPNNSDNTLPSTITDDHKSFLNLVNIGGADGEPDLFNYNFFGYSGKLIFEKGQQSSQVLRGISIDQNNMYFEYHIQNREWTVKNDKGWIFKLKTPEVTTSYSKSQNFPYEAEFISPSITQGNSHTSAWYLDSVTTPEGDSIIFQYDSDDHLVTSQVHHQEIRHTLMDFETIVLQGNRVKGPKLASISPYYMVNMESVRTVYLNSIEFENGRVVFRTNGREDLRSVQDESSNSALKLYEIEVYDSHNKSIKKLNFDQGYFNANKIGDSNQSNYLRLKLNGFTESFLSGAEYVSKPPHEFIYNESIVLPKKNSYAVDHWGYYNGQVNSSSRIYNGNRRYLDINFYWDQGLSVQPINDSDPAVNTGNQFAPTLVSSHNDFSVGLSLPGADREPNRTFMQAGVLTDIKYPTKGRTSLIYEPNDYSIDGNKLFNKEIKSPSISVKYDGTGAAEYKEFTLNEATLVEVIYSYSRYSTSTPPRQHFINATLKNLDNGLNALYFGPVYNDLTRTAFNSKRTIVLPAGRYSLNLDRRGYENALMILSVNFFKQEKISKKIGGGLRIKTIQKKDSNGTVVEEIDHIYEENGKSTGRLMSPVRNFYNQRIIEQVTETKPGFVSNVIYVSDHVVRNSNSSIPTGAGASGSPIGYDKVFVTNGQGRSEYFYKNNEEFISSSPDDVVNPFMPGVPNLLHNDNGQLLEEKHFNQDGDLVRYKQVEYFEQKETRIRMKGVKTFRHHKFPATSPYQVRFYDIESEWWYPNKEIETVYDKNGDNPYTVEKEFQYKNWDHRLLTHTTTLTNKDEEYISETVYPQDIPVNSRTAAERRLIGLNKLSTPIKSLVTKKENEVTHSISEVYNQYKDWGSNVIAPEVISTLRGEETADNTYQNRIRYYSYDTQGNPLQVSKEAGSSIVYIWAYNKTYPVAKIENASYSDIQNHVTGIQTQADKDTDRTFGYEGEEGKLRRLLDAVRISLRETKPTAMVTTYTFDPLIGITSMTDARGYTMYYHYDTFNRLQYVKDAEGNLISENKYNYKN